MLDGLVFAFVLQLYVYETHVRVAAHPRGGPHLYKPPPKLPPLAGCFSGARVSATYNLTERLYGSKSNEIQTGLSLKLGLDCYQLAGTIDSRNEVGTEGIILYHTYSESLSHRQEWMLKSFFATQDLTRSRLILWSHKDISHDSSIRKYLHNYPSSFDVRVLDSSLNFSSDSQTLQPDHDTVIPFLVLWHFRDVWLDINVLLAKDLNPLLEHKFVMEWGCDGSPFSYSINDY